MKDQDEEDFILDPYIILILLWAVGRWAIWQAGYLTILLAFFGKEE